MRSYHNLTFPKLPCPRTLRSSNCAGDAFSHPSFVTSLNSISCSVVAAAEAADEVTEAAAEVEVAAEVAGAAVGAA